MPIRSRLRMSEYICWWMQPAIADLAIVKIILLGSKKKQQIIHTGSSLYLENFWVLCLPPLISDECRWLTNVRHRPRREREQCGGEFLKILELQREGVTHYFSTVQTYFFRAFEVESVVIAAWPTIKSNTRFWVKISWPSAAVTVEHTHRIRK